jgi:hypothetical protein
MSVTIQRDRTQGFLLIALATLLTLAAALAFGAATADKASAQLTPDICNQYPGVPQCQEAAGGGGGSDPGGGSAAIPGGGDSGSASNVGTKGTLPFTGYPINALILLLLVLLASGLTIRAYVAIRNRLRARDSGAPTSAT